MFDSLKRKLFGGSERTVSKKRAMSRLHFVLVQDRTGLTPSEMVTFKSELMSVLEKYFVIDRQGFDVAYKRDTDSTTLLINSPIVVRRQDIPGGTVGTEKMRSEAAPKETANKESGKGSASVAAVKDKVEKNKSEKDTKKETEEVKAQSKDVKSVKAKNEDKAAVKTSKETKTPEVANS